MTTVQQQQIEPIREPPALEKSNSLNVCMQVSEGLWEFWQSAEVSVGQERLNVASTFARKDTTHPIFITQLQNSLLRHPCQPNNKRAANKLFRLALLHKPYELENYTLTCSFLFFLGLFFLILFLSARHYKPLRWEETY